jgi:hypothetical protein
VAKIEVKAAIRRFFERIRDFFERFTAEIHASNGSVSALGAHRLVLQFRRRRHLSVARRLNHFGGRGDFVSKKQSMAVADLSGWSSRFRDRSQSDPVNF